MEEGQFDLKRWIAIQQAANGDVAYIDKDDENEVVQFSPAVLSNMERYQKMSSLLIKEELDRDKFLFSKEQFKASNELDKAKLNLEREKIALEKEKLEMQFKHEIEVKNMDYQMMLVKAKEEFKSLAVKFGALLAGWIIAEIIRGMVTAYGVRLGVTAEVWTGGGISSPTLKNQLPRWTAVSSALKDGLLAMK